MQQGKVVQGRDVGRIDRERALEMAPGAFVPPQFGEDDPHVGKHFLGMIDAEIEGFLVLDQRFLEPPAAPQETGEIESRDREFRLAGDQLAVTELCVGALALLLEEGGNLKVILHGAQARPCLS